MDDLRAKTLDGRDTVLSAADMRAFRTRIRGDIITGQSKEYDQARKLWNGMIDKRPALIVRCSAVSDVVAAVNLARERNLLLAVRGGGHNVAGTALAEGGVVIDLSLMRAVSVDPHKRTARAQGGATLGDLDRETQSFGLATPLGVVSETGIAGLTLGGGYGWLARKHGLASDNLLSAEVVTADGQLRTASLTENPDLFWAVRGGGGNFGVVTYFQYRLHPVGPTVMVQASFYPVARAVQVIRFVRDFMAAAPEDLGMIATLWSASEAPIFPPGMAGEPVVAYIAVYTGPLEEGPRALQPLRDLGAPLAEVSSPMPFTEAQTFFNEDYPDGMLYYWKSIYVDTLSDEAIDAIVARGMERPSAKSSLDIWFLGGAFSRVPPDATAFWHRSAQVLVAAEANWTDPQHSDANIAWSRSVVSGLQPYSSGGLYQNFAGFGEGGNRLLRDIYGANYERLLDVKTKYDPGNLFRVNHNLAPRPGGSPRSG